MRCIDCGSEYSTIKCPVCKENYKRSHYSEFHDSQLSQNKKEGSHNDHKIVYCKQCGRVLVDGICSSCGRQHKSTNLNQDFSSYHKTYQGSGTTQIKGSNKGVIYGIAIFFIIIVFWIASNIQQNQGFNELFKQLNWNQSQQEQIKVSPE